MLNYFNIQNKIELEIKETTNSSHFKINDLFKIGLRINPKRSFLFISTVLGKHLDVHPETPKAVGYLLAQKLTDNLSVINRENNEESIKEISNAIITNNFTENVKLKMNKTLELGENVLFVGFAETATGLGHAVSSVFSNSTYVHTTRVLINDEVSIFNFEEEHSHATSHMCYLSPNVIDFSKIDEIVLIDDEITTGKTALNLIESLNKKYSIDKYTVLSILDWRNSSDLGKYIDFQKKYNIEINCVSLFSGNLEIKKEEIIEEQKTEKDKEVIANTKKTVRTIETRMENRKHYRVKDNVENCTLESYLMNTGRFGISGKNNSEIEVECNNIGKHLRDLREHKNTLCIGTEELIYLPSRIASYMGEGVTYKSSTRSPIWVSEAEDYVINDKLTYDLGDGVSKYIYNLRNKDYKEVFIFFEGNLIPEDTKDEITAQMNSAGIENINFIFI